MMLQTLYPLLFSLLSAVSNLPVTTGGQAPPFTVADSEGHMLDLGTLLKSGPVVVAFFPKAQTGGCTQEMRAFVSHEAMLKKYHATLLAVSRDDAAAMQAFRKSLNATFAFVPDTEGVLMRQYKSKMPLVTVAHRKTFVINTQGTIVWITEGSDAIALKGIEAALKQAQAPSLGSKS